MCARDEPLSRSGPNGRLLRSGREPIVAAVAHSFSDSFSLGLSSLRWWEQGPFLLNANVLRFLRKESRGGRIRASASAILLFDHSWHKDMASWRLLGAEASWSKVVPFDERKLCRSRARRLVNCKRAHGNFTVAVFPLGLNSRSSSAPPRRLSMLRMVESTQPSIFGGSTDPFFTTWGWPSEAEIIKMINYTIAIVCWCLLLGVCSFVFLTCFI